jgi:dTDP-4-dehydrorhamnose 3,5-epimerase
MTFTEMKIPGAWVHTPTRFGDSRGYFEEQFKLSLVESEIGRAFPVKQVNQSRSGKGVIRGIHWTDSPEGQAKYVSCINGAMWDVVVDLRPGSPTYGQWDAETITPENGKSVLISEGLGHVFLALEDGTVANYLCTSEYNPSAEKTINPLDPNLAIGFELLANRHSIPSLTLSEKDRNGPSF